MEINDVFNKLYDEYELYIRNLCEHKLESAPEYIDDCVQDVFLDLYEALKKGKEIQYYKAWLSKVASNKIKDIYTKVNKEKALFVTLEIEKVENLYTKNVEDEAFAADLEKEVSEYMSRILKSLNEEELKLLTDRYKLKKSVAEIAKERNTSENNIFQRLFRLRTKTKMLIKKFLDK